MSVYNRKLFFNRGGQVSARGTGITDGLAIPKRGYVDGPGSYQGKGEEILPDLMNERLKLLQSLDLGRPETSSKLSTASPALLELGGRLLSGKSYQGGFSGALDILGQATAESAPSFAKAAQTRNQQKQAQANFDNQLKLKAFDLAYDEYTKLNVSEFKPADVKTFYSKITPNETLDIDLNNKNSEVYTNSKFLESWTIEKPKGFTSANPKTFWSNDGKTQKTVDLNNENSIFYTDKNFRKNNTMEKPPGFKPANPKIFYKIGNKQESIIVDLADQTSPFYTDPKFKEMYTMEKPTPAKEKTVYYTNLDTTEDTPLSQKYSQVRQKTENGVNTYFFDGEFISEKDFLETVGRDISTEIPLGYTATLAGKEDRLINTRKTVQEMYKTSYLGEELTTTELDNLILQFTDDSGNLRDTIKQTDAGEINELDNEMYRIHKNKKESVDNKVAVSEVNEVITGRKDPIDYYYNLDPEAPDYNVRKRQAQEDYANREAMSPTDREGVDAAILGLQDLALVDLEKFGGIPIIGRTVANIAQVLGVSDSMAAFLLSGSGLLVNSVDALVKGIPSDFDVRNVKKTLIDPSLPPSVNRLRKKRLNRIFTDIILNKVKFDLQMGKVVPFNYIDAAISAGGEGTAAEILRLVKGGGDGDRMDYISKIGLVEGYTKQGYIETFNDPFASSKKLIDSLPKEGDKGRVLTDEEQRELDEFRKGNNF
tara:strand:- start:3448 stop:5577 length:2130 start_codon:yes stop_codon:yes gene_type:complete